ncbi:MAG: PAS domain S-box protein [Candidatus Bathyarchaeia archaeon]
MTLRTEEQANNMFNTYTPPAKVNNLIVDTNPLITGIEDRSSVIFYLHPEATVLTDLSGKVIDCNKAYLDLCKCEDASEILGKSIFDFISESEYSDIVKRLKESESGIRGVEVIFSDRSRHKFPVEVSANFLRDSNNNIIGIILSLRDISERKKIIDNLLQEKKMFDILMESIPDAIYFKDVNSRFIRINKPKAIRLGLKSPEEAIGKTDFDFYHPDFAREAYEDEQRIMKTGEPLIGKIEEVKVKDGKIRWVSATKIPIVDENRKIIGLVGISRDITDLKLMEKKLEHAYMELKKHVEELQRVQEELKRSNRDLENYTYVVSHDLKAPLRAIRSFISFLLEDYSDKLEGEGLEYLKRIDAAATRMNEFIEDLLLLSRVGRKFMEIERVDLNELLDEITQDFKPIIESKRAKIIISRLPVLYIQRVWIKQLFTNLIDNGLKFNKSEVPTVEVSCEEMPNEYLFRVKDNGIGIREEHLGRLFNLFERLHPSEEYEGIGAGLAICKKIVEGWGGRIWAESVFGKGSTFCFTIPKKYGSMEDVRGND